MTTDERTRRALALFDDLVDLDQQTRALALSRLHAEDALLHQEVCTLLEADLGDGPLEQPAFSTLPLAELEAPARIGPWRITGSAGRGGMGEVYLGERADGQFEQRAAIKLIRLGMDTPLLRARFLRERQILAALKHPHIAMLLDGGVTDTGAPYFAMERVEGQPIDAWCDARRASVRERVRLFLQVCSAVQHAHQNLVVHRDLKPANILIDHSGQAKLLDFGIAKVLDGETALTGERPHTPDYAAPEQLSGGDITTATDVYGLGVVLHELLCGRPPKGEPLSRNAASASPEQVRARGLASKKALLHTVRGDLSAIVQQCLPRDPAQRYATVNALAQDLRAWLKGTPVAARRPTAGYVVRKFISRNRGGVAAGVVLLLAIGTGVAGVAWQAAKTHRAAAQAQAQLDYLGTLLHTLAPSTAEARELNRSRLIAEAARKARAELADQPGSLASVEFALAHVAEDTGDYPQAMQLADSAYALRRALLGEDALASAEVLVLAGALRTQLSPPRFDEAAQMLDAAIASARRQAPGSALLVRGLVRRSTLLADQDQMADQQRVLTEAIALCDRALAAEAICEEVWLEQGSVASRNRLADQALAPLRRAWEARKKRLGDDDASTLQVESTLALAQAEAGDFAGGLALAEEVHAANQRIYTQPTEASLLAMLRLSRLLKRTGKYERAEAMIDEYVLHARRLFGESNQNTILGFSDRASLLFGLGRFEEAAAQFDVTSKAYRAVRSDINAALTQAYAGDSRREAGHPAQALPEQLEAVATLRRLYPKGENVMLARALTNLALTEAALGQLERSLAHHDEGLAMHRKLQRPGASDTAFAQAQRGKTVFDLGRTAEGEHELRAAIDGLSAVKATQPNQFWEPFALLTHVACANHATDCDDLTRQAREAQALTLSATCQTRLREALAVKR
jgi:eukaryotic-like serine/threonine-protein kinase